MQYKFPEAQAAQTRREGKAAVEEKTETPVYQKPTLLDYGALAQLTAGTKSGNFLDATFPVHTPKNKLTFSG